MKFFKISKELSNLLEKYMKKWVKVHRIYLKNTNTDNSKQKAPTS